MLVALVGGCVGSVGSSVGGSVDVLDEAGSDFFAGCAPPPLPSLLLAGIDVDGCDGDVASLRSDGMAVRVEGGSAGASNSADVTGESKIEATAAAAAAAVDVCARFAPGSGLFAVFCAAFCMKSERRSSLIFVMLKCGCSVTNEHLSEPLTRSTDAELFSMPQ